MYLHDYFFRKLQTYDKSTSYIHKLKRALLQENVLLVQLLIDTPMEVKHRFK